MVGLAANLILWSLYTITLALIAVAPITVFLTAGLLLAVVNAGRMDGWL